MKYLPFFLLFSFALNAQEPKVSIYQPDDVKLHTKRKPPLTVGECIGFLQEHAPHVFQFRSMMGADTVRTTVEVVDTTYSVWPLAQTVQAEGTRFMQVDSGPPTPDPVDAWAFLSPTDKPVTYSTPKPKIRPIRARDTVTVYRWLKPDPCPDMDAAQIPTEGPNFGPSPARRAFIGLALLIGVIALLLAIGYGRRKTNRNL